MTETDTDSSLKGAPTATETRHVTETRVDQVESTATSAEIQIISLTDRLDVVTSIQLRQTVQQKIDAGQPNLLVDLSVVDLVDSAGLAALVRGMKQARNAGGDLRLVRPRRSEAMRVFELTTFDKIFTMGDNAQDMINQWGTS